MQTFPLKWVFVVCEVVLASLFAMSAWLLYSNHRLDEQIETQQHTIETLNSSMSQLQTQDSEHAETATQPEVPKINTALAEAQCAAHYKDPDTRYLEEADSARLQSNMQTSLNDYARMQAAGMPTPTTASILEQDSDGFYAVKYNQCLSAIGQ